MKSSFCIDLQRFMLIPTKFPLNRKGIYRYDYGCRRIQERHALTRERPVLLDQPQPDYRIGMVAHG